MKFLIQRTSTIMFPWDREGNPLPEAEGYYRDFETIDELVEWMKIINEHRIILIANSTIDEPTIEIYDDYRE